jgi:hypothetical protein
MTRLQLNTLKFLSFKLAEEYFLKAWYIFLPFLDIPECIYVGTGNVQ